MQFSPATRGRLWMLLSGVSFALMMASVRYTAETHGMHPFQITFFRNLFGLLVLVPFILRAGRGAFRTAHAHLHLARSALQAVYMLATFYILTIVPLAAYTALSFSAPLFASVGAIAILGERFYARRFAALAAGFAGVLIVLRPGLAAIDPGALAVVAAAMVWAACLLIIKSLARHDSSTTITAWFTCAVTVLSLPPALWVWTWPDATQLAWLALLGIFGTTAHMSLAQAFKHADASAVLPFDLLRLVWMTALGFVVFGQQPDVAALAGGVLIFTGATWLALMERRGKSA